MIRILVLVPLCLAAVAAITWFAFEAGVPEFLWECGARVRSWNKRRRERRMAEFWKRLEDLTK